MAAAKRGTVRLVQHARAFFNNLDMHHGRRHTHRRPRRAFVAAASLGAATALLAPLRAARASTPVVVQNEAGFEGLESPTVLYFPASNTFQNDTTGFVKEIDEGGGMFRQQLRNEYPTPQPPYAAGPGWWDGDGANSANTDRQRVEPKGIVGLGHQPVDTTFEYSFDFRTDPTFTATNNFCHIFQLKALDGDNSPPLATISLYKNGSGIQGRVDCFSDGTSGTPQTETIPATYSYTAGQWIHFVIRITPCKQGETTGGIQLSVNGGAFTGVTNQAIDLQNSSTFRPKFGLYRSISTGNGVPVDVSWVEHRTVTGYDGSSNLLTWQGGQNSNTWDTGSTPNFLNGSTGSVFNTIDQVNFTGSTNTTINLSGQVWPDFADVNSSANYTFQGTGSITGGTLRKDGTGTLTLATTNSYPGLTDVRAGTLFVTGSIGNNSLASVTGGTLKLGSTTALGSSNSNGTQIAGGTFDINGFAVGSEPISVQGTGVGGNGAIINSGASQTSAMTNVTLTGDATFGGTGRWDIRGSGAMLSTAGSAFNLTKTGSNQISFVGATVDSALGNITINQGVLAFQTSTSSMGDPTKSLTIASGAILEFFNTANAMTKVCTLNGGTVWAESGTGSQNTFAGPITLGASGGTLDAGSALTGGTANPNAVLSIGGAIGGSGALTKNGPGTVTLANTDTYTGSTTVNAGVLNVAAGASIASTTVSVAGGATLNVNGSLASNATVNDNGTVNFAGNGGTRTLTKLSIGSGDLATVGQSSSTQSPEILQPVTLALAADGTSRLNLFNNELITVGNASSMRGLIGTGQIFTTSSGGALGYMDLTGGQEEVRFTLSGDTNLDGVVNVSDLANLAANFGVTSGAVWIGGDMDYNGTVNVADLSDLAANFGSALPAAAVAASPAVATSVPEPVDLAPVFSGVVALQACRRSRRVRRYSDDPDPSTAPTR
jgi:autotransporter-associated beta strand protein